MKYINIYEYISYRHCELNIFSMSAYTLTSPSVCEISFPLQEADHLSEWSNHITIASFYTHFCYKNSTCGYYSFGVAIVNAFSVFFFFLAKYVQLNIYYDSINLTTKSCMILYCKDYFHIRR